MPKRQLKKSTKYFEVIPQEKTDIRCDEHKSPIQAKKINEILDITKIRNSKIQERKRLVQSSREVHKAIYNLSQEISHYDDQINERISVLN